MLYVLTALKCEAAAIEGLPGEHIVTGVGSSASKAIEKIDAGPSDSVLNVGCAAGIKGGCYVINSITDESSGRRYYPDLMAGHVLPEAPLITSSGTANPVSKTCTCFAVSSSHFIVATSPLRTICRQISPDDTVYPLGGLTSVIFRLPRGR